MKSLARPYTYEKKMVSGLSCDIIVHQSLTCAINFIELFAELVFSESSGNDGDDVDLYEVVRRMWSFKGRRCPLDNLRYLNYLKNVVMKITIFQSLAQCFHLEIGKSKGPIDVDRS